MCGIAGIFHFAGEKDLAPEIIMKMTSSLHHRGPDESGIYLDDHIGLGHTRLSIIDLAGGTQPIHNEDQTLWIIYNGEVFNYPELKDHLLKKGHRFYTTTDTEVILHLFEEQGPACLQRLNGQFAIAIWNSEKQELFLARDRVGIRPLFYTLQNGSILFASEIKSIFISDQVNRQLDHNALNQIFHLWTTLPGETAFQNIKQLPPGYYMKVSRDHCSTTRFWELPFYPTEEKLDWPSDRICEQILALLTDAIRIRLRADVPVGCYLSGGLDSSGVTALVVQNFNRNARTFGIRFEENDFDEGVHQKLMVDFLKTNHTELQATNENIGRALENVLWHCETPLLRTAPIPLFLLSDVVNQSDFKVVLTGEGADEVFGGYNIFREAKVRRYWAKQPESQRRGLLVGRLYPYIFKNPRLKVMQQNFFATGLDQVHDPLFSHSLRWQNTSKISTFFSNQVIEATDIHADYERLKQSLPNSFASWDYFEKAQYLEMTLFLSNYLLSSQGDRVAMAHSLEIRLPYLDYRVIDFMAKIPSQWKIRGMKEKYILKKTFRNILPEPIVTRPKHPYRAPIGKSLLNARMIQATEDRLSEQKLKKSGLFDGAKVNKLLQKLKAIESPSEVDNMALVGILSTQIIYDQFIENFPIRHSPTIAPTLMIDRRTKNE